MFANGVRHGQLLPLRPRVSYSLSSRHCRVAQQHHAWRARPQSLERAQLPRCAWQGRGGGKALAMHPTVKDVAMIADLLLDASAPGEAVLDCFGGSGTTLIATVVVRERATRARSRQTSPPGSR